MNINDNDESFWLPMLGPSPLVGSLQGVTLDVIFYDKKLNLNLKPTLVCISYSEDSHGNNSERHKTTMELF